MEANIKFKCTEEAIDYGRANMGNLTIRQQLVEQRAAYLKEVTRLSEEGDIQGAIYLASGQSQLTREAIEALDGKLQRLNINKG